MSTGCDIRADYNRETIVVYQAYSKRIALPALEKQRFVEPFSLQRMTWIKPSYLWLMERSNWATKSGQEMILAVRMSRKGWEEALSEAVLTSPEKGVYRDAEEWQRQFAQARVHVQWDPERTLRGQKLAERSIQVGISRHLIQKYVDEWVLEIQDYTPLTRKIAALLKAGQESKARSFLPRERPYPLPATLARRLGM